MEYLASTTNIPENLVEYTKTNCLSGLPEKPYRIEQKSSISEKTRSGIPPDLSCILENVFKTTSRTMADTPQRTVAERIEVFQNVKAQGWSIEEVATQLGIPRATLKSYFDAEEDYTPPRLTRRRSAWCPLGSSLQLMLLSREWLL